MPPNPPGPQGISAKAANFLLQVLAQSTREKPSSVEVHTVIEPRLDLLSGSVTWTAAADHLKFWQLFNVIATSVQAERCTLYLY